jgi:Asp/Glu/Hydantoin racemase
MHLNAPRIALIHATPLAMVPVVQAFERLWPTAVLANLLDDSLTADLAAAGGLNEEITERMLTLARYVRNNGANGILFTCSSVGPAIEAAAALLDVPTLKPNEAMYEEALEMCRASATPARAGLLTTFAQASAPMEAEFIEMASLGDATVPLDCAFAQGAMTLLQHGDAAAHDAAIAAAASQLPEAAVLMLGQFSMARALPTVRSATGKPVLTSPESAVRKLQRALT